MIPTDVQKYIKTDPCKFIKEGGSSFEALFIKLTLTD